MLGLKNSFRNVLFLVLLVCPASCVYSANSLQSHPFANARSKGSVVEKGCKSKKKCHDVPRRMSYYLYIADFISSFIVIPSANVLPDSSTITSSYLAGRAPLYNEQNQRFGVCSASFLCIQNEVDIFNDIANYLAVDNGLIVTWFTPTTLINLELDTIVNSMVTECIVIASTKVGVNPFYGQKFNMVVSSDGEKIYFDLTGI